jgi:uncharacterized phage infection (PIP) family protein YhgE
METVLQILAICTLGYVLLIAIAVTAIVVFFVLKRKEESSVEPSQNDVIEANTYEIMRRINKSAKELPNKLDEIGRSLDGLADSKQTVKDLSDEITQLRVNLKTATDINGKLKLRIKELEAQLSKTSDNANDEEAAAREAYYKQKLLDERKLRNGVCQSINLLINTRGSNSVNYLSERIENAIKILDDAREIIDEE